ncbi:hypothetical protein ACNTMW_21760 [Planosporangium sp. 12N6]|uniref:hypothetical protein n=1 Tax=Planosporangium spinosum TaxID=3402278 RepID=UPI003CFB52A4
MSAPREDNVSAPRDESGVWRDDQRLPLSELHKAMAQYSFDGQIDDPTGGDAGSEQEFGDEERLAEWKASRDPDPDTEAGRRLRPSPEGHSGPG